MQYTPREPISAPPERDDSPIGIVSLWRLLWRNKLRIAAPTILATLLTVVLVLRSEDIYSAEAQLLLTRDNLEIVEFDSAGGFDVAPGAISNAMTIMASRSLASQVMERLDLTADPRINPNLAPTEAEESYSDAEVRKLALDWLEDVVQISAEPGTNVLSIRAVTTDAETSAAVANAYAEVYLDYQRSLGRSETERAAEALDQRVSDLRLRLEADQEAVQTFRGSAQSVTPQAADTLASEAAFIRARLDTTEAALTDLAALTERLDAAAADRLDALRGQINGSETLGRLERSVLGRQIAPQSFDADATALRDAIEEERGRLERLRDVLSQSLEDIEKQIADANAYQVGLRQLEVDLETTSQVYAASLARLKELSIQTGLRDAGAQILSSAEPPLVPSAQGRRRTVAVALVLGFFIGIAYVLLREAANDRVRGVSDLLELAGPEPVVHIPPAGKRILTGRRTKDRQAPKAAVGPFYEGIRTLRQQLLSPSDGGDRAFSAGVFSALPNEGKSTVTDALARSLTLIGKRVIVIDADMRTGALSRSLGAGHDAPGLKEVVGENIDPADAIISLPDIGYDLLPSGHSEANPADLLESPRFSELVAALHEGYDVVLFDTPPVLVVPDGRRIAAQIDRHVFLTSYDKSPRAAVREALATLLDAGCDRPVVALCNAPGALGEQSWVNRREYEAYAG